MVFLVIITIYYNTVSRKNIYYIFGLIGVVTSVHILTCPPAYAWVFPHMFDVSALATSEMV